jgi:hypothetical protein
MSPRMRKLRALHSNGPFADHRKHSSIVKNPCLLARYLAMDLYITILNQVAHIVTTVVTSIPHNDQNFRWNAMGTTAVQCPCEYNFICLCKHRSPLELWLCSINNNASLIYGEYFPIKISLVGDSLSPAPCGVTAIRTRSTGRVLCYSTLSRQPFVN